MSPSVSELEPLPAASAAAASPAAAVSAGTVGPTVTDLDGSWALARPPLDLAALFGNAQPVELEIGCGRGRFIAAAARAQPDVNFLGIEQSRKFFRQSAEAVLAANPGAATAAGINVRLLPVEAGAVVRNFLPVGSLRAVHVYYPDPWPKRRHQHRRLLSADFLTVLARTLITGGRLLFQTDVASYFAAVTGHLSRQAALWSVIETGEIPPEQQASAETAGTHWEHRSRREGLSAFRLIAVRRP